MDSSIAEKLTAINLQFYQSCAHSFSQTRQRVQPGVRKVIASYLPLFDKSNLLDLGCGNGDLISALDEAHFSGQYIGLDFSIRLMQENTYQPVHFHPEFQEADITRTGWSASLVEKPFQFILSFAVLHHIPAREVRLNLLREIRSILHPEGWFIFSVWQFTRSPRLVKRVQPWSTIQVDPASVDEGDYLLDWRASEEATNVYRYVHVFTEPELTDLADKAGFVRIERFSSDGKEGNLSDYEVWKASG